LPEIKTVKPRTSAGGTRMITGCIVLDICENSVPTVEPLRQKMGNDPYSLAASFDFRLIYYSFSEQQKTTGISTWIRW